LEITLINLQLTNLHESILYLILSIRSLF